MYGYSGDNKRVYKRLPDLTEEYYFYRVDGRKLGTYSVTTGPIGGVQRKTENLYFAGKLIGNRDAFEGYQPVAVDRLGSVRSGGQRYYPYGEEQQTTQQDRERFATYYRDGTSGLDYADQRYYASTVGRFLTADPYQGSAGPEHPGSWNRYAYVEGDPVNFLDPLGLVRCGDIGVAGSTKIVNDLLDMGTDLGLVATTVFVESAMRRDQNGRTEMAAIAAVIINRYNILNDVVQMPRDNNTFQQAPEAWGAADGTIRSIVVNSTQFEVWQGTRRNTE